MFIFFSKLIVFFYSVIYINIRLNKNGEFIIYIIGIENEIKY